jgi:hypothetical protein
MRWLRSLRKARREPSCARFVCVVWCFAERSIGHHLHGCVAALLEDPASASWWGPLSFPQRSNRDMAPIRAADEGEPPPFLIRHP